MLKRIVVAVAAGHIDRFRCFEAILVGIDSIMAAGPGQYARCCNSNNSSKTAA